MCGFDSIAVVVKVLFEVGQFVSKYWCSVYRYCCYHLSFFEVSEGDLTVGQTPFEVDHL